MRNPRGGSAGPPPLSARGRALGAAAAWLLYCAASPGAVAPDGSAALAVLAVAVWGAVELRPHRGPAWRGWLAHALGAAPGAALVLHWIRFVYWPPLVYIGLGYGVYSALGGAMARALSTRLPLALAVALGWTGMEALRSLVPIPFGLPWLRLGHFPSEVPWFAGSARVWGIEGLTLALAAVAGLAAALVRERWRALRPASLAFGLVPLALAPLLAALVPPPRTVDGPRVLLVQPGFSQERKQWTDQRENFRASVRLTREGSEALAARGEPPPDLVCWGETMLYLDLFEEEVRERVLGGEERVAEWPRLPTPADIAYNETRETVWVRRELFGLGPRRALPAIPQGASFLSGAEVWAVADGVVRRHNAIVLYGPTGRRRPGFAAKRYLVPGAETMYGLEAVEPVRDVIRAISGYVPDFLPARETGVLELPARDGRRFRIGATVCFDNAFVAPYTDPVRDEGVDLHVVVSNEAWYRESFEYDQMMAFSRIAAIASGRSMVRATNAGISAVIGPDGREVARLVVGGRDRLVGGTLAAVVPVPAEGEGGPMPYARARPALAALAAGLPAFLALVLALCRRARART